jgi:enhancing lycopene biosynthesis protein 2
LVQQQKSKQMKIGVIFSGSGVFDGTEIQEGVFTLLSIKKAGAEAVCFAPDIEQHHVINHMTGEEMPEKRNVLVESARITRGEIQSLDAFDTTELDALVLPGGFGAAKNLSKWAFSGPDGEINAQVKDAIASMAKAGKPIAGLCMGPTVIAKALEGTGIGATLTVGTTEEASPYEIGAISQGMEKAGATAVMKNIYEVSVDSENRIVTAPCYMMEADILQVRNNVQKAIDELVKLV